jgi:hypothetical protein
MNTLVMPKEVWLRRIEESALPSLARLLLTTNPDTLIAIIDDGDTPECILSMLSTHPDVRVRSAVADHPEVPYSILVRLAVDECEDIRYQLAENHNLPVSILSILAEDENPYVQARALWTLTNPTPVARRA